MQPSEEFVEKFLAHRGDEPYDPVKRRERYLRSRELKGRTSTKIEEDRERRRRETEAKVEELRDRLSKLREILAQLVKEAKARSGVEGDAKSSKKSSDNTSKMTEKEKSEAAKASKEYYEKNKDEILDEQVKSLNAKIDRVKQKIDDMREKLSVKSKSSSRKG